MEQEIEIEFKNLLTKPEYKQLLKQMPFSQTCKRQTNYYFETTTFALRNRSSALRIREKNNHYTLTFKEPYEQGLLETNIQLTQREVKQFLQHQTTNNEQVNNLLAKIGIFPNDLMYYGYLTTHRRKLTCYNYEIVLDHSFYNGKQDYELECEVNEYKNGKKIFQDILNRFNIPIRKTPSKIERFFNSL